MIEKIKKSFKNISYITTFIVTLIGLYTFFMHEYAQRFGIENDNLQILNVDFKPSISFFDQKSGFYGDCVVVVTVKNFGNKTIRLTSGVIKIEGNQILDSQCSGIGIKTLNKNPKKSAVIKIDPGDEKKIQFSRHISFKSIIHYLSKNDLTKVPVVKISDEYFLQDIRMEEYMEKKFSNSLIHIKLYTNYKKIIKDHTVDFIDSGKTLNSDGKIHYNSFLADLVAIKQGLLKYGFQ